MPSKILNKVFSPVMTRARKKRMAQKEAPGNNETAWEKAANARPGPCMNCGGEGLSGLGGSGWGEWRSDRLAMCVLDRGQRHRAVDGRQKAECLPSCVSFTSRGLSLLL